MNKPLVWQPWTQRHRYRIALRHLERDAGSNRRCANSLTLRIRPPSEPRSIRCASGQPGLVRAYLKEKPVAIHTHSYKATLPARTLLRPLGARLCTTYHAGETLKGKMALYGWLQNTPGF